MLRGLVVVAVATGALFLGTALPAFAQEENRGFVFVESESDTEFVLELEGDESHFGLVEATSAGALSVDLSANFIVRLRRASDCEVVARYTLAEGVYGVEITSADAVRIKRVEYSDLVELPETERCAGLPDSSTGGDPSATSIGPLGLVGGFLAGLALALRSRRAA